jgi:hypothetical protein
VTWLKWKVVSVRLEMELILTQDRCIVGAKLTIGPITILDALDGVMRLKWKLSLVCLEIVVILTQDRCTVCAECTIGLKIILDAPIGTRRCRGSCGIFFRSVQS